MKTDPRNPRPTHSQIDAIFPMLSDAHVPVGLSPPSGGRISLWRDGTRSTWLADDPGGLDVMRDGSFARQRTTEALHDVNTDSLLLIAADKTAPTAVDDEFELSYITLDLVGRLESDGDRSIATSAQWKDFEIWLASMLEDAFLHETVLWIALCEDDGAAQLTTQSFIGAADDTVELELACSSASNDEHLGHQSTHLFEELDTVIARAGRLLTDTFREFAPSPLQLRFGFTQPEPARTRRNRQGASPVETSDS